MPAKNPHTERFGGPGSAHENRKHPEKSDVHGEHPAARKSRVYSGVSGGGGEPDRHHAHTPPAGRPATGEAAGARPAARRAQDDPSIRGIHQESDHNKHNQAGQSGHGPQKHTQAEQKP